MHLRLSSYNHYLGSHGRGIKPDNYISLNVELYVNVQDTRAKNAFNARVIRFFGKCYQLIINNQADTQRLILTFTQ